MPASSDGISSTTVAALLQQMIHVSDSIVELKSMLTQLAERMRSVELSDASAAGSQQLISGLGIRVTLIERTLVRVEDLLKIKDKILVTVAVSGFVGTLLGSAAIMFLFRTLTGE